MNVEWLLLTIPIGMALYARWKFPGQLCWWELALTLAVCVVSIAVSRAVLTLGIEADREALVEYAVRASYEKEHTSYAPSISVGPKGSVTTSMHSVTCSAKYRVYGARGAEVDIDSFTYRRLEGEWKNGSQREAMNTTSWPGTPETARFVVTNHDYLNPLRLSRKAYGFPHVTSKIIESYQLHPYPANESKFASAMIRGTTGRRVTNRDEAEFKLKHLNATKGREQNFHAWILLFPGQRPDAAWYQEALWEGGKRNEFVVCLGIDAFDQIMWSKAFSWTPDQTLVTRFENWAEPGMQLNLVEVVDELDTILSESWRPRDFAAAPLEVELPYWGIFLVGFVTTMTGLGVLGYATKNEFRTTSSE